MRRLLYVVTGMGTTLFLLAMWNVRGLRDEHPAMAAAQQLPRNWSASSVELDRSRSTPGARANAIPAIPVSAQAIPTDSNQRPTQANRFDRGRLGEEFDGAFFKSGTSRRSTPAPAPTTDAFAVESSDSPSAPPPSELMVDSANDLLFAQAPSRSIPSPTSIPSPSVSSESKGRLIPVPGRRRPASPAETFDAPGFEAPAPARQVSSARVALILSRDHQIRVVSESRVTDAFAKEIAPEALLIMAEEFQLTPLTEPGNGQQLNCSGKVQLRCQQFAAEGAKLSIIGNDLVLEGTADSKATIVKQETEDGSNFHLSAEKIAFTLSLDKIQVGTKVTVSSSGSGPNTGKASLGTIEDDAGLKDESVPSAPTVPRTRPRRSDSSAPELFGPDSEAPDSSIPDALPDTTTAVPKKSAPPVPASPAPDLEPIPESVPEKSGPDLEPNLELPAPEEKPEPDAKPNELPTDPAA